VVDKDVSISFIRLEEAGHCSQGKSVESAKSQKSQKIFKKKRTKEITEGRHTPFHARLCSFFSTHKAQNDE